MGDFVRYNIIHLFFGLNDIVIFHYEDDIFSENINITSTQNCTENFW